MRQLRAIDIFSGCGGLTLGLKRAGFEVCGAVEVDKSAVGVYRANHPEVRVWHCDIRRLSCAQITRTLRIQRGELELLAGCPPCQGFSTMRTLNGAYRVDDDRNDLIYEFSRLVRGLLPKTIMMENVPGLASDTRMRDFIQALERLGYNTNYAVLDAAKYGVPQRRKRLILLAARTGRIRFAPRSRKLRTVRDAIGSLPSAGASGDPLHDLPERRSQSVARFISRIPLDGGSRTDLPRSSQLECHRNCNGFKDVYGRMAWDRVAPTITTGCFNPSKGRFLHPEHNRGITMREAALLQGFPGDYEFPVEFGKSKIAELIGNALPPEFVTRHARMIQRHLYSN